MSKRATSKDLKLYVVGSGIEGDGGIPAALPEQHTEFHALGFGKLFGEREVSGDKLKKSWENTRNVLVAMIADAGKTEKAGFHLSEMEVNLAVSGSGNIGFVAAKAEAGITLKFVRS